MLKSGAGKFVMAGWYKSVQTRTLPLSPFLNLSGAPASPNVGLCTGCRCQGLECSATCSECRGVCENVMPPDDNTDEKDGDFELQLR